MGRLVHAALAGVLLASAPASAQAVRVCVQVESADDPVGLTRLVRSEVDAHETHRAVDTGCDQHLRVELFSVGDERFLTGRLDALVPERVEVEELTDAVEEMVTVLLHNDPVRLEGPGSDSGIAGALSRLRRSRRSWGVALEERIALLGGKVAALPGLALRLRRELPQWSVGAVFGLNPRLTPGLQELHARLIARLGFTATWASSAEAEHVALFGFQLGLMHIWTNGPVMGRPDLDDEAFGTGPYLGLTTGAELFRSAVSRLSLRLSIDLPLFLVRDEAELVTRSWVPSLSVGVALHL
ncbi:MAG: hypothetical protein JJ863_09520 [Deltaproteobacteria bacterium]|nr:hypothetical protein [Deltaproteobacteria bacterium]